MTGHRAATAVVLAGALVAGLAGCTTGRAAAPQDSWQIQLTGAPDLGVDALVYDLDPYTTAAGTVDRLHRAGRRAICHLAVGVSEAGRPDAGRFPPEVLGAPTADGRGAWLDVRRLDVLTPILADRLRLCRDKGFDAVDADDVDAYRQPTGFPLTQADQLAFDRRVLALARDEGLGAGLRVPAADAAALAGELDFAVNVGCPTSDGGCAGLAPLVVAGKPVYVAVLGDPAACADARLPGYRLIVKRPELDAWRQTC
ncbi:MAG TPA: endo alpha-1,4 polygalactosaminidase [Rugosimonospora sp.]|nr:endo alpha-1,4 polygalactosaminidase [Rugosimonospora sp.]